MSTGFQDGMVFSGRGTVPSTPISATNSMALAAVGLAIWDQQSAAKGVVLACRPTRLLALCSAHLMVLCWPTTMEGASLLHLDVSSGFLSRFQLVFSFFYLPIYLRKI